MARETSLNSDRLETARAIQDLREKASKLIKQWKRPENLFVLNAQKAAFVIIDMQNFSCAPVDGVALPRIGTVVTQINRLADFCREKGIPVIWVRQNITSTGTLDDAGLYSLFHDKDHTESTMNLGNGTEIYSENQEKRRFEFYNLRDSQRYNKNRNSAAASQDNRKN